MYLLNNEIYFLKNEYSNILKYSLPKDILKYGKINKFKSFEKYFKKMLCKYNIEKIFSSGNLKIIVNNTYTDLDKKIIKELCNEFNFINVFFVNELVILNDFKNKVYIIHCEDYTLFHLIHNNKMVTNVIYGEYLNEIYKNKKLMIDKNIKYIANIKNNNHLAKEIDTFEINNYPEFLMLKVYEMNNINKKT